MDTDDIILSMGFLLLITTSVLSLKRRRNRRYKVRPVNRYRRRYGHYHNLVKFIKENDYEQYFKYTRMSPNQFNFLLKLVGPRLKKCSAKGALSPSFRLTMTLHYLAEGCSMQQIAWDYYIGKSTVHCIIKDTCSVIWDILSPIFIPTPTKEDFAKIAEGFHKRWNMPLCIGAFDGKHIIIQAPKLTGSEYFNYKKSFSLILMAACDAYYRFTLVDIGQSGANHDSHVFKDASYGNAILNEGLEFPVDLTLPGQDSALPHFFVADQAFPLHRRIMRPYPGHQLGEVKNIFNYRLSRARRTIENTFGILAQRWRVLRKPIIADIHNCELIVQAVVCLHNYLQTSEYDIPEQDRKYCPTGNVDYVDVNGQYHFGEWRKENNVLRSIGRFGSNNSKRSFQANRDALAKYFISQEGSVSWQQNYILRGS